MTRSANVPCSNPRDQVHTLCKQLLHNASSEAYYAEASYRKFEQSQPIVMHAQGSAINDLPLIKTKKTKKSWGCSPLCKTDNGYVLNKLKAF